MRKQASGDEGRLRYDESVEEALCFGWIDSKANKLDERRYLQFFAPRRPGSNWARTNKERVARLEAAGLMAPAGRAAVEAARKDGTWTALDEVEDLVEPATCARRLTPSRGRARSGTRSRARRSGDPRVDPVRQAAETRRKRVEETAALAADGVRANQWPRATRP